MYIDGEGTVLRFLALQAWVLLTPDTPLPNSSREGRET